jgi:hypothetical protein
MWNELEEKDELDNILRYSSSTACLPQSCPRTEYDSSRIEQLNLRLPRADHRGRGDSPELRSSFFPPDRQGLSLFDSTRTRNTDEGASSAVIVAQKSLPRGELPTPKSTHVLRLCKASRSRTCVTVGGRKARYSRVLGRRTDSFLPGIDHLLNVRVSLFFYQGITQTVTYNFCDYQTSASTALRQVLLVRLATIYRSASPKSTGIV